MDGTTDIYLIDRCGSLIRIERGSRTLKEYCGDIAENLFSPLQGRELGIEQLDDGTLRFGTGFTAVDFVPMDSDDVSLDSTWLGHWYRYEITEQDFLLSNDGLETAQNDPVRIAVGGADGGPWLYVGPQGGGVSRARFGQFSFTISGSEFSRKLHVEAQGCQNKPRDMDVFFEEGALVFHERIFSDRNDEFRLRVYRFQR